MSSMSCMSVKHTFENERMRWQNGAKKYENLPKK